jgi:DNA-binding transcriptional ArsR family regulator
MIKGIQMKDIESVLTRIETAFTIRDLETLKVVSDPLRVKILDMISLANQAGELRTVKQISERLDLQPHKLYYHINLLEKHGLVLVADTQVVSGIIEKHYRVRARQIVVDRDLFRTGLSEGERAEAAFSLLDSVFESARDDLGQTLSLIDPTGKPGLGDRQGHITRDLARLSQKQADAFYKKLLALIKTFVEMEPETGAESRVFSLSVVMLPTGGNGGDLPAQK